jgi:2-haloacid dehalogenase
MEWWQGIAESEHTVGEIVTDEKCLFFLLDVILRSHKCQKTTEKLNLDVNWGEFVDKWRVDGYTAALIKIATGQMEIQSIEVIHLNKLHLLLEEYNITGLTQAEKKHLNLAWNRLSIWEDVLEGLHLLKKDFMIMPFSNGDYRCLLEISKFNDLPWDGIIFADFFKKVKPDVTIYQDAADLLLMNPGEILMVAAHAKDLEAASQAGMKTADVNRPLESGPDAPPEEKPIPFDYDVDSFIELADVLKESAINQ